MKNSVEIGMNKTGLKLAPVQSEGLFDGEDDKFKSFAQAPEDPAPELSYLDLRKRYIEESGAIGSVPPPPTAKGAMVSGFQKITGRNPEVLVDKLGERLAFERTGARLYESLIAKCETQLADNEIAFLHEIREDEVRHFGLLHDCIVEIGADPTALTPCADVAGVMAKGMVAVINDPRTSIAQSVNAILVVELADVEGWDMLISLVREAGMTETAERFEAAKAEEDRHVQRVRTWLKELVSANDVLELH